MSKKILVVDDSASIRSIIRKIVQEIGHTPFLAKNGKEGLQLATEIQPDLVTLDIMMPVMDGWGFLQNFRCQSIFAFTPVIYCTDMNSLDVRRHIFQIGADDFICKPFPPEELKFRINKAINYAGYIRADVQNKLPEENSTLQGSLEVIGAASVISFLSMEKSSGTLQITRVQNGNLEEIDIIWQDGNITATILEGYSNKPEILVYYLLSWPKGEFQFLHNETLGEKTIESSLMSLLMEGTRRLDEARKNQVATETSQYLTYLCSQFDDN